MGCGGSANRGPTANVAVVENFIKNVREYIQQQEDDKGSILEAIKSAVSEGATIKIEGCNSDKDTSHLDYWAVKDSLHGPELFVAFVNKLREAYENGLKRYECKVEPSKHEASVVVAHLAILVYVKGGGVIEGVDKYRFATAVSDAEKGKEPVVQITEINSTLGHFHYDAYLNDTAVVTFVRHAMSLFSHGKSKDLIGLFKDDGSLTYDVDYGKCTFSGTFTKGSKDEKKSLQAFFGMVKDHVEIDEDKQTGWVLHFKDMKPIGDGGEENKAPSYSLGDTEIQMKLHQTVSLKIDDRVIKDEATHTIRLLKDPQAFGLIESWTIEGCKDLTEAFVSEEDEVKKLKEEEEVVAKAEERAAELSKAAEETKQHIAEENAKVEASKQKQEAARRASVVATKHVEEEQARIDQLKAEGGHEAEIEEEKEKLALAVEEKKKQEEILAEEAKVIAAEEAELESLEKKKNDDEAAAQKAAAEAKAKRKKRKRKRKKRGKARSRSRSRSPATSRS